ncbi:hypothetical protein QLQ12_19760 [Actinoplanes sp. NEAU-A12]|uniref:Uncharacterized protein n=1 Tax=Actinoplanes sandaracinus TaxID=3045177 RepID=A0ABT6WM91_9ACTN|nr:hypothetical protein [Actinoplanes sandaracinus]MDI6100852.1 hypothetical protein [Actinoplanes sandaracinus]
MTPYQHAARAEKLVADAERLFAGIEAGDVGESGPRRAELERFTNIVALAQVHATLALTRAPATASFEQPYEGLGGGLGPDAVIDTEVVHYGDGDPTYDRR